MAPSLDLPQVVDRIEFQGRICWSAKRPLFMSRSGRASERYWINKTKDFSESLRRAVHRSTTWKHLSKPFIRPSWPVLRKLWHIETTPFKKFMTNLRKWEKLTHVPRFPMSTVKPKSCGDKTQNVLRSRSVGCLLSHVIVDAIATHFLEFYWFRMLSWIRNFLATNGKGYDNSRLSDDIHRGSRQIHDKWLRFTCPSCT